MNAEKCMQLVQRIRMDLDMLEEELGGMAEEEPMEDEGEEMPEEEESEPMQSRSAPKMAALVLMAKKRLGKK